MKNRQKKMKFVLLSIGLISFPFTCNAQNSQNEDYVMHYDLETKETTYYGYNSNTHDFYEVAEPISVQGINSVPDGSSDITDIDANEYEWAEPGTVYMDNEPIKEGADSPYAVIFSSDGIPLVYKYDSTLEEPWTVIDQNEVNLLEGTVKKVRKSSLTFTDKKNHDFKIYITQDEQWQPGDKIKVIGLVEEKEKQSKLIKQYGYFKSEAED